MFTADDLLGIDVVLTHQIEEVVHPGMPGRPPRLDFEVGVGLDRTGNTRNIEIRPTKGSLTVLKT